MPARLTRLRCRLFGTPTRNVGATVSGEIRPRLRSTSRYGAVSQSDPPVNSSLRHYEVTLSHPPDTALAATYGAGQGRRMMQGGGERAAGGSVQEDRDGTVIDRDKQKHIITTTNNNEKLKEGS